MIHVSTEGVEFESSDMESKEPEKAAMGDETKPRVDWEGAWRELDKEWSQATGPYFAIDVIRRFMRQTLRSYTTAPPKPETLDDVVREFLNHEFGPNYDARKRNELMQKMRELTKETE